MTLIFFLLFQIGFEIKVYQNEAILGEPIIAEANKDFSDILNFYQNEIYIEIERGEKIECFPIENFVKIEETSQRINFSDLLKEPGNYKVSIIFDPMKTCKTDKMPNFIIKNKDQLREIGKKEGNFLIFCEKNIKINYPIDFDKDFYSNVLLKEKNLDSFWERYNKKMDEILKHPESNYYPWALYLNINQKLKYPMRKGEYLDSIEKDIEKFISIVSQTKIEKEKIEKFNQLIERIKIMEERWKNFPFFYEIEFERLILGFILKDKNYEIKKRCEEIIKNSKNEGLKNVAKKILEKIK